MLTSENIKVIRAQFPSLMREQDGLPVIYFDGPAGSQVPKRVADRISHCLVHHSANRSGKFSTSREVDQIMEAAHGAAADFFGASDAREVVFGANMTTLTMHFSRTLARTWNEGDEVVVTRLDHDANVTPWVLAAQDRGVVVRYIDIHPQDCTLDVEDFQRQVNERTKLIAFTCASNSVGSLTPIRKLVDLAHQRGAMVYLDATHFAPHARMKVNEWDADFVACSAYKFYGPHIGMVWAKRLWLEQIAPYKLRPSPNTVPASWMTGTQNHACIAGVTEAIDYLADLGRSLSGQMDASRSVALDHAFKHIEQYEQSLIWKLIGGLRQYSQIQIAGIVDPVRGHDRVPTIAFTVNGATS
ncbi:MAG: putative cysteine desulfurase, partial [Planctomycetota bacterium]